jgi:hypothetical protein
MLATPSLSECTKIGISTLCKETFLPERSTIWASSKIRSRDSRSSFEALAISTDCRVAPGAKKNLQFYGNANVTHGRLHTARSRYAKPPSKQSSTARICASFRSRRASARLPACCVAPIQVSPSISTLRERGPLSTSTLAGSDARALSRSGSARPIIPAEASIGSRSKTRRLPL